MGDYTHTYKTQFNKITATFSKEKIKSIVKPGITVRKLVKCISFFSSIMTDTPGVQWCQLSRQGISLSLIIVLLRDFALCSLLFWLSKTNCSCSSQYRSLISSTSLHQSKVPLVEFVLARRRCFMLNYCETKVLFACNGDSRKFCQGISQ